MLQDATLKMLMGDRMHRFAVRNFRSIQSCEVALSPLTFFIGANASGKSSIVDAIRFVSTALTGSLSLAIDIRGGTYGIFHHPVSLPATSSFDYYLSSNEGLKCEFHLELVSVDGSSVEVSYEECRVEHARGERHHYVVKEGVVSGSAPVFPATGTDQVYLRNASGLPEFRFLYDYFYSFRFAESWNPRVHQLLQHLDEENSLARNFRDFVRDQPDRIEVVQDYLRAITPSLDHLDVEDIGGQLRMRFIENSPKNGPVAFYLLQASAGVVTSADLLLDLFSLPSKGRPAGAVIVEEPEAYLHPGAIQVVRDAFVEASQFRQVLVTTHSPELLDDRLVPADWIRAVYKDEYGTHVDMLDKQTESIIGDQLYTAGQLLRQGALSR